MGAGNLLTKLTGAYALYLSVVDSHRIGIATKNKAPKNYIAKTLPDKYIASQRLNWESLPTIVNDAKKSWFNFQINDSFMPALKGVTGYISGFFGGLTNNIFPIGLGIGALASKRFGKYCAIGLVIGAVSSILTNVVGIGRPKQL